jgi:transcriptional regulator with XRE-family HTH domain
MHPRHRQGLAAAPTAPSVLREARLAKGLSLANVARRADIDLGQLSKVERGAAGLSIGSLLRLADVLGLTEVTDALEPFVVQRSA